MATHGSLALLGVSAQVALALALGGLFLLWRGELRRGKYFTLWSASWFALFVSLVAVATSSVGTFGVAPHLAWPAGGAATAGAAFLFQAGKLAHGLLLLAGTARFARGARHPRLLPVGLAVAGVAAAAAVVWASDFSGLLTMQAPLLAAAYGISALLLFGLPRPRRTKAAWIAAAAMAGLAARSLLLPFGSQEGALASWGDLPVFLDALERLGPAVDLALDLALALGMVLLASEEERGELAAAYAQLEVAYDRLERDLNLDPLTGALNRRALLTRAGLGELDGCFGAVAVLDVDALKEINDRHGHAVGDEALRHLASVLRHSLRPGDPIFRLGGDEFAVVLPRALARDAAARIGEILAAAPALVVESPGQASRAIDVHASFGCAAFESGRELAAALARADRAMYDRKRERRRLHEPEPVEV